MYLIMHMLMIYSCTDTANLSPLSPLLQCVNQIKSWLTSNFFNLNNKKCHLILFGFGHCPLELLSFSPSSGTLEYFLIINCVMWSRWIVLRA